MPGSCISSTSSSSFIFVSNVVSIVLTIDFFETGTLAPTLAFLITPPDSSFGELYCLYFESSFVVPKQYGERCASKRRRAGMQTQKIPTKASRTDQYAVGTLSNVGFVEVANWMSDWRRMMDMTVVLITPVVSTDIHR